MSSLPIKSKWFKKLLKSFIILFLLLNVIVIFHAYKFTHFYEAVENPMKKPDQYSFMDKTKAIVLGIDGYKRPETEQPSIPFQAVTIETEDGVQLDCWDIPKDSSKGTIIMFHGHGSNKGALENEMNAFHSLGYRLFMVDFRAHGKSAGNTTTIGMKETMDVKAAYDYIVSKGEKNIILWGISLGSSTVTNAIHTYASIQPAKVILEMPFGSLPEAVESRMKIMGLPPQPLSTLLTFWGGVINGRWAFNMQPAEFAKEIKCPAIILWGRKDNRVRESEVDKMFANLPNANKQIVKFDSSGHQSLCFNEHEKWMKNVEAFLK
jgi:uncharacterized protein